MLMVLLAVLAFVDVHRSPFAMAVLDSHRANSEVELDQEDIRLVILVERQVSMDAGSLDLKLAVLASFYRLNYANKIVFS